MTLTILIIVLMFLGIFMAFVPAMPWSLYMFALVVLYGVLNHFDTLEPWHLAIFGAFVVLGYLVDYSSGLIGARIGGASKRSMFAGAIGLIAGLIIFPPLGAFAGLFFGILIAELMQLKNHAQALKAASFSVLGTLGGVVINVCLAITFFISFLVIVF